MWEVFETSSGSYPVAGFGISRAATVSVG